VLSEKFPHCISPASYSLALPIQGHMVCNVPHSSVSASCSSAFGLTPTTPECVAPELILMMQIRDSVRLPAGVIRTV